MNWVYECNIIPANDAEMKENKETFGVKHCTECNRSYEMDGSKIYYHLDFPTFGLKREVCCECDN